METTQVHTLNLTGVLSTSKKIILTNYSHFITLSLFFIPLSFSLIITPTLRLPVKPFSDDLPNHQKVLISYLPHILIVHVLSLCAIGTITYSTHHAFSGEPVKISDALKSLTVSFFPLASTAIGAYALIILISLTFLMFVGIILMLVHNLWFVIDYNSIYFMWFSSIIGVILIAIIVYFYVEWSLASTVVVVESKWGFAALMRSSYLVKGMRSVSLLAMLYFGVCGAVIVWSYFVNFDDPISWLFVVLTMLALFCLSTFLLRITAANTVLYNYCKALHGELAIEVAEGFGNDYVKLAFDDEKVPHVVSVVAV